MSNGGNGRRPIQWGDVIYRTLLMALVIGGGGAAWKNAIDTAKVQTQIVTHLSGHPDVGLTIRMNDFQRQHDELERRVRLLEIRRGPYRENE